MRFFITQGVYYQYNVRRKLPWLKISEIIITIFILLMFLGAAYQIIFTKIDENKYKLKGKMVDIGGYRLFTNATGEGKFTVVFESDMGKPYQQWNKVREPVSKNARVFTYERSGYGGSDSGTTPKDIAKSVRELKAVLKKSANKAPYILVGHGYGGMIMMKYAEQYPDEVASLVLIDSWTDDYVKSKEFKDKLEKDILKARMMTYSSYLGIPRLAEKFNLLKHDDELMKNLSADIKSIYESQLVTLKYNKALYSELKSMQSYSDNIKINGMLGEKPVYILTSLNHNLPEDKGKQWEEWQKNLKVLSAKSEIIDIKDSSTYVQLDKSEEIINILNTIIRKGGK